MDNLIGPILKDDELFSVLDTSNKNLLEIQKLYTSGDIINAKTALCRYVRENLNTTAYYSIPGKTPSNTLSESARLRADRAISHYMVSCGTPMQFDGPVDWFANPTFNQYKEWTWQLSRHPEIAAAAAAYKTTKEEKYAEGAVELLHSWIKQAIRPEKDVNSYATKCWRTIECGIRLLGAWPSIIHNLIDSPAFTDEVLIDVLKSLYEHGIRLEEHPTHGNWLIMELDGLINLGVMFPFFDRSKEWVARSVETFAKEMTSQIHPDGFQYELTTNYHSVVMTNTSVVIGVLEAYNYPVPKELYDAMDLMCELFVKLTMSGGLISDVNDGRRSPVKNYLSSYIKYYRNKEVGKYIMSDYKEGTPPSYNSILLENSGIVIFREGWDHNAVTAHFDAGKFGRGHQHEDKLSLLVYAGGKVLLTEGNTYAYDDSPMRRYVLSTYAHNTATVNDMGQNRRKNFKWSDEMISSVEPVKLLSTKTIDKATGEYNEGYGPDLYPVKHKREVIFVKKPAQGIPFFIVNDTFESENNDDYQILWHVESEEVKVEGNVISNDDLTLILGADVSEVSIVKGQEEPIFQGFTARTAKQLDYYPIPTVVATARGKKARAITVIIPKSDGKSAIKGMTYNNEGVTITYSNGEKDSFAIE